MALSILGTDNHRSGQIKIDWATVQLAQFEHDEKYHREISRLPTQDRLRHMALHFAKYAGRLLDEPSEAEFRLVATDSFIIAVSSSNILNLDLSKLDLDDSPLSASNLDFVRQLAIAAGKMAAACEKLDHLEDFPFRKVLSQETLTILRACLELFAARGWNPVQVAAARLGPIKAKSIFHAKA